MQLILLFFFFEGLQKDWSVRGWHLYLRLWIKRWREFYWVLVIETCLSWYDVLGEGEILTGSILVPIWVSFTHSWFFFGGYRWGMNRWSHRSRNLIELRLRFCLYCCGLLWKGALHFAPLPSFSDIWQHDVSCSLVSQRIPFFIKFFIDLVYFKLISKLQLAVCDGWHTFRVKIKCHRLRLGFDRLFQVIRWKGRLFSRRRGISPYWHVDFILYKLNLSN